MYECASDEECMISYQVPVGGRLADWSWLNTAVRGCLIGM